MTREEAIRIIETVFQDEYVYKYYDSITHQALNMAIEALQEEPIKYKDCRQRHIGGSVTHYYWCDLWDREVDDTDFCAWGERKGGDENET